MVETTIFRVVETEICRDWPKIVEIEIFPRLSLISVPDNTNQYPKIITTPILIPVSALPVLIAHKVQSKLLVQSVLFVQNDLLVQRSKFERHYIRAEYGDMGFLSCSGS